MIAADRSSYLVGVASNHRPHAAIVADSLSLPHPARRFDFAISIAVIHHLSTRSRRIQSITALLDALKRPALRGEPSGKALIFVWALEQKNSRRGWDSDDDQDVLVPWAMKTTSKDEPSRRREERVRTESSTCNANGCDIMERGLEVDRQDCLFTKQTFQRYYHLYRQGELEHDIKTAGGFVLESGYERDNWWAVAAPMH